MFVKEHTKTVTTKITLNPPRWLELAMEGKEDDAITELRGFCALTGAQGRSIVRSITDNLTVEVKEQ